MSSKLKTIRFLFRNQFSTLLSLVAASGFSGLLEAAGLIYFVHLFSVDLGISQAPRISFLVNEYLPYLSSGTSSQRVWIFVVLGGLSVLLKLVAEVMSGNLELKCQNGMRQETFEKFLNAKWEKLVVTKLGKTTDLLLSRPQHLSMAVSQSIGLVSNFANCLVVLMVALYFSATMTVAILAFSAVFAANYLLLRGRIQYHSSKFPDLNKNLGVLSEEFLGNIKLLKSTGVREGARKKFQTVLDELVNAGNAVNWYRSFSQAILRLGGIIMMATVFCVSVSFGWVPISEALTFLAIFYRVTPRLQLVFSHLVGLRVCGPLIADYQAHIAAMDRCSMKELGEVTPKFEREVRFETVTFRYQEGGKEFLLRNISFSIKKGKAVALIGPSGCGKSTLVDMLTGLLIPDIGKITVDGVSLQDFKLDMWRQKLGLVPQNAPVFHATVGENIAWARPIHRTQLIAAAKTANALGFIEQLPKGFDTLLGHRGLLLSGGQQQRIALARAIYHQPDILIFDEATNNLDGECERSLHMELTALKGAYTILWVTHRMESLKLADEILVIEKGCIVDRGTYESLIETPGNYLFLESRKSEGSRNFYWR